MALPVGAAGEPRQYQQQQEEPDDAAYERAGRA